MREPRTFENKRVLPLTDRQQQLLDLITANPGIKRTELSLLTGLTRSRMIAICDTLMDHDLIHTEQLGGGATYQLTYWPGSY